LTPSEDSTPVVRTESLSKVYRSGFLGRRRHRALANLSLAVRPGEIFALLGPNGSGKTTLVKILTGLLRPSGGKARVLGREPGHPDSLARLGYLSEAPAFLPLLTGEETLHLAGRLFGLDRRTRTGRIQALLTRVGLDQEKKRPVAHYSQGMQKRLALAQALINDPQLLLLDEPTAALDPLFVEIFQNILRDAARAGKTILLNSHLLSRVEEVATRVCILHEGNAVRQGTLEDVAGIPGALDLRVKAREPGAARRVLEQAGLEVESCRAASRILKDVYLEETRRAGKFDGAPAEKENAPEGGEKPHARPTP